MYFVKDVSAVGSLIQCGIEVEPLAICGRQEKFCVPQRIICGIDVTYQISRFEALRTPAYAKMQGLVSHINVAETTSILSLIVSLDWIVGLLDRGQLDRGKLNGTVRPYHVQED